MVRGWWNGATGKAICTVVVLALVVMLSHSAAYAGGTTEPPLTGAAPVFEPVVEPEPIAAAIAWRVANPFRFFLDPKDTDLHRATYVSLSEDARQSPVLSSERALSENHPEGWAATMVDDVCWDARTNRHRCKALGDSYLKPAAHGVNLTLTGVEDATVDCLWLTAPGGGAKERGKSLRQKCSEEARLDIPFPGGATVSVEIGGREVARSVVKVQDILIGGIGDSFGSGEGNPDLPVRFSPERAVDYGNVKKDDRLIGLPARVGAWKRIGDATFNAGGARWLDQACHRSLYAHQLRAALQLAIEDPHRAVTFVGLACSGAEVTFGLFLRYKGNEWVPNPPDLSQISALAEAQCGANTAPQIDMPEAYHMGGVISELKGGLVLRKCPRDEARKIDLLLVSIGGNDIGFARLVANAVLADQSIIRQLGGWFGQIHGNMQSKALMDRLDERYKALNRALHGILHMPWGESDRIILTAYPPLAVLGDGRRICPDGAAGMDVASDFSLSQKRAKDSSDLADNLQRIMARSARVHGWSFASSHRSQFLGRGICAGFTDNAFSVADDLRIPRRVGDKWEPFAPTDYRPYASRQRWFRTPNDAFLTGNFHAAGSVATRALAFQSLQRLQVLLAATYSGAFHPTAEGHAAIADSVVAKARTVLKKYGQQSTAALLP